jgi:hypothetical protein
VTNSASPEEIAQVVGLGDILLSEMGRVNMVDNADYNWAILVAIHNADQIAYRVLDKLSAAHPELKLAMRMLRPRATQASQVLYDAVIKMQAEHREKDNQIKSFQAADSAT